MALSICVQMALLLSPNTALSCAPGVGRHRLIRSGRGLPHRFFNVPVITKAAPWARQRPRIPQLSSQSRSQIVYLLRRPVVLR